MEARLVINTLLSSLSALLATIACVLVYWRGGLKRYLYLLLGGVCGYFTVAYFLILIGVVNSRTAGESYLRPAIPVIFFLIACLAFIDYTRQRRY